MTKRKVNLLITLMAFALAGIIVLQVVWLKNAVEVRNELFNRGVTEAMNRTVKRMENLSDMFFVKDLVKPTSHTVIHPSKGSSVYFEAESIVHSHDSVLLEFEKKPRIIRTQKNNWVIGGNNFDSLKNDISVQVIQYDSVISDLEERIEHQITVMVDNTTKVTQKDTTIIIHRPDFDVRVNNKKDRLKDMAGQMVFESFVWNHERVPDTASVNQFLHEELKQQGVPVNFEMGVYYGKNRFVKSNRADSIRLASSQFVSNLNPNQIFDRGERLHVYFPTRNVYIFKSLLLPLLLSLLFCVLIMVVFVLSIYYILNQKKISEMKSDFINNMTHEFKTPLATISVATDTIVNPKVIGNEKQIRHFSGIIKNENRRMNQQVESILQIARFDKKDFEFDFTLVDIHRIIEKSVQTNKIRVENQQGEIRMNFKALNSIVTTDADHCLNLINNLIDNAIKYSKDELQITIETQNDERGVWISVSDKGIGMSSAVQQKVFEKFYRETSGNVHNVKGFGLGLSYVKEVVDINKGNVKVTSELGKGSTFKVFLPFSLTV